MEWIICPAPGCGKKIKNLRLHYRSSHPDLNVPDMRKLDQVTDPAQPKEQAEPVPQEPIHEQPRQEPAESPSDLLQKLKAFGISPADVMAALGPLVEDHVLAFKGLARADLLQTLQLLVVQLDKQFRRSEAVFDRGHVPMVVQWGGGTKFLGLPVMLLGRAYI